jgi:hypothetical protein
VYVTGAEPCESIGVIREFSPDATAILTDLTEARPLIQVKLTVKIHNFGHKTSGLVDCVAPLDFVSEDFVRRCLLTIPQIQGPFRDGKG